MIRITDVLDKISEHNPDADLDVVERAYIYAARSHEGQMRLDGEPYLSHPLEVAGILADMRLDVVSVAAGLLHDVIEDTAALPENITAMFGPEVLHIVSGVTKLSSLKFSNSAVRHAESIRKMLLAMADDIRVILIKLVDRLHNMRTLRYHKTEAKKRKIAQETMDIYAPLAARLGIYWIKNELEDIAFMYISPENYEDIKNRVNKEKVEREKYVETVKSHIQTNMEQHHLQCEVLGRYKNFFSIYNKMVSQELTFEEIYDLIAFRIILNSVQQCYEALGIVHAMWKPIDIKFKDYIARPKPNMYQSLHTTVVGPRGERIEIQIRTWEMDKVAKSGIAAHWGYKEGRQEDETVRRSFAWLQNLIENQENIRDPDEFMESVRIDLFPDEVHVFTPNGEIKSLPKGATPVDFAYMIHTEVGNKCYGAKVNNRIVPLAYQLKTGDSVEIITKKNHHPSKDWLNFVKTVKARARIRQWVKYQERERSITLGREICEKAFRKVRLNFNSILKSEDFNRIVQDFGLKSADDLIADVGYGKITPLQVIHKVAPRPEPEELTPEAEIEALLPAKTSHKAQRQKIPTGVVVKGEEDILTKFGRCCEPVPGDAIVGYITRGYGITVHRKNCVNVLKMTPERQVEVDWDVNTQQSYRVKIRMSARDRKGLLADVTAGISSNDANIVDVRSVTRENKLVESHFTLAVKNTEHLTHVINTIRQIKGVQDVKRIDR